MRSEGTVVGLSVCLYLAGRAFIRSTNDATYLTGNEVENICAILSETSPLQSLSPTGIVPLTSAAAIFPRLGTRLRTIFFEHVCAAAIFLWQRRRAGTCELLFSLPIMPPSKVCPKCQAVKRMRMLEKLRKTTKRASETSEQTVHRREQDRAHKASS